MVSWENISFYVITNVWETKNEMEKKTLFRETASAFTEIPRFSWEKISQF